MILKRWVWNLVGIFFASIGGVYGLQYLDQHLMIPKVAAVLIFCSFVAGCFVVINLLGQVMFRPTEVEVIRPDTAPRQPWAWLRPRNGGMKPGFPINKGQVSVGRDVRCDVMVNHDSVSRRHAEVVRLAEGYMLRDLNSRNGTFVNGQRVEERMLQDGDVVGFGDKQLIFSAPKRPEPVEFEEVEDRPASVLCPEPLPLDGDYSAGDFNGYDTEVGEVGENGTEVWRN